MRDYEDLVKSLRYCAEYDCTTVCPRAGTGNGCITRLKKEAADAIEELSKPKWIPVTERLPGTGEVVLVSGKRGGIYTAEHNRNARWPGTFWKLNSKSHHCEPTHWMPLPEPPEVDKPCQS